MTFYILNQFINQFILFLEVKRMWRKVAAAAASRDSSSSQSTAAIVYGEKLLLFILILTTAVFFLVLMIKLPNLQDQTNINNNEQLIIKQLIEQQSHQIEPLVIRNTTQLRQVRAPRSFYKFN